MYSLKATERQIREGAKKLGFDPEYHSISQIQQANAHFKSIYHPETGILTRDLKADEQRWIQNEILLCACDFRYYCNYVRISDTQNRLIRFIPNIAQNMCIDIWAEAEEMGVSVSCQNLKARQLGISSIIISVHFNYFCYCSWRIYGKSI